MTKPVTNQKKSLFHICVDKDKLIQALDTLSQGLSLTPLKGKKPYRVGWQKEKTVDREIIKQDILSGKATGFGLRLGEISGDLIDLDIDSEEALQLLIALSHGDLLDTPSWTSNKSGSSHLLYRIPERHREALRGLTRIVADDFPNGRKVKEQGKLEFRANNHQSAIPPSWHPETDEYKHINSFETTPIAVLPESLCQFLIKCLTNKNSTNRENKIAQTELDRKTTLKVEKKNFGSNNSDDLISFLYNEIYSKLDLVQAFLGFELMRESGHDLWGSPGYRVSESGKSFSITQKDGYFAYVDFKEGHSGDCIAYRHKLKGGCGYPTGKDFVNIVKDLADEVGLQLPKYKSESFANPELKSEYKLTDYELKVASEQKRLNGT